MMGGAATLSREDAAVFSRRVSQDESLQGGKLAAMAGAQMVDLYSVAEVAEFLHPVTGEELMQLGTSARIYHLEPRMLAAWVREVIGDLELAADLDTVADSPKAYGLLVPDLKELLMARLAEYDAACASDGS
jgi:hypothetical protein